MIANTPSSSIQALNKESLGATSPLFPNLNQVDMDLLPHEGSASSNETDGDQNGERPGPLFPFWKFGRAAMRD
jgi:hypothetical protein